MLATYSPIIPKNNAFIPTENSINNHVVVNPLGKKYSVPAPYINLNIINITPAKNIKKKIKKPNKDNALIGEVEN